MRNKFWSEGLRFQCQGSGQCCVSRGGYGYVYLTKQDRHAMANVLQMKTTQFTKEYCELSDGIWKLKDSPTENCIFLKDHRCTVYKGRPTQCRTWPFWPENMNAKTWNHEVAGFCAGVGKGPLVSAQEIEQQLQAQRESEQEYGS